MIASPTVLGSLRDNDLEAEETAFVAKHQLDNFFQTEYGVAAAYESPLASPRNSEHSIGIQNALDNRFRLTYDRLLTVDRVFAEEFASTESAYRTLRPPEDQTNGDMLRRTFLHGSTAPTDTGTPPTPQELKRWRDGALLWQFFQYCDACVLRVIFAEVYGNQSKTESYETMTEFLAEFLGKSLLPPFYESFFY